MSFSKFPFEWNFFFKQIDTKEKSKASFLILINDELNLESLNIIKRFAYSSKNLVKIKTINSSFFENKSYTSYFKNKISDIEKPSRFCFLLSSNIRLESAVLNAKLRSKYLAQNISIINTGLNPNLNLPTEYINLNLSKILSFFEGKNLKFSKFFLSSKNPLFFFGLSFKNRFNKINLLISHIKNVVPSSTIFILEEHCNSVGLELLNIKSLCKKDIIDSEILISINLKDTLFIRNFLKSNRFMESFSFNSYIPEKVFEYDMVIPISNHYETEGTFINLEGRPQRNMKLDTKSSFVRSIKNIFLAIKTNTRTNFSFLNYIEEIIENPKCFNLLENKFITFKNVSSHNIVTKLSFYPLQSALEDFYTKDLFCKKSLIMLKRSQEIRNSFNNFQ